MSVGSGRIPNVNELECATAASEIQCHAPSVLETTTRRLAQMQQEVLRLTELKALLEKNPEVQRILELMQARL